MGIPCRKIVGFALGLGQERQWTEEIVNGKETNHGWVQAYIDNRWVTIDSTWDTGNKFVDGVMNYEGLENYLHFDTSLEFASSSHKFMSVDSEY